MQAALDRALKLADEIERFPLRNCGPSDDPDEQTAYVYAFLDLAKPFVSAVKRLGDADLSSPLEALDLNPFMITGAYSLKAELQGIIDHLRELALDDTYASSAKANVSFLEPSVLATLKELKTFKFDLAKLTRYCEELNDAYGRANFLTSALLIRAVMNHVPPIFGKETFAQVVAQSSRSVKAILDRLEDGARLVGDLHSHALIRQTEPLPTKHQVEPFKAPFEILMQEIIAVLSK